MAGQMTEHEERLFQEGLGNITWWGFSPLSCSLTREDDQEDVVLVIGGGDGRHVVRGLEETLPDTGDLPSRRQVGHFFVLDQSLALYARQMLLWSLLQEASKASPVTSNEDVLSGDKGGGILLESVQRTMEIFGNTALRPATAQRMRSLCRQLEEEILQWENERLVLGFVDLSRLKARDREALAAIFKFWTSEKATALDPKAMWDQRLRQLLQERFASMDGVIDMDYGLRMADRGGSIISRLEYSHWRKTGLAFVWEEDEATTGQTIHPNPTILSSQGHAKDGTRQTGFFGDVVTGPFLSFLGNQRVQKRPSDPPQDGLLKRSARDEAQEYMVRLLEGCQVAAKDRGHSSRSSVFPRVTFLPPNCVEKGLPKSLEGQIDVVFVGCSLSHVLEEPLLECLKSQSGSMNRLVIETPLFLLHLADELQAKFRLHLEQVLEKCSDRYEYSIEGDDDALKASEAENEVVGGTTWSIDNSLITVEIKRK